MVKNNWSNPELKELSIENTLEATPYAYGDKYKCKSCSNIWTATFLPTGIICPNCFSTKIEKIESES